MKSRSRRLCLETVSRPDFDCLVSVERKVFVYIPGTTTIYGFHVTILMDVGHIMTSLSNAEHWVRLYEQNRSCLKADYCETILVCSSSYLPYPCSGEISWCFRWRRSMMLQSLHTENTRLISRVIIFDLWPIWSLFGGTSLTWSPWWLSAWLQWPIEIQYNWLCHLFSLISNTAILDIMKTSKL